MDAHVTAQIIALAGGDAAFARLLGIDGKPGFQQRVNNWKRRGIPPSVIVQHYEKIQKIVKKIDASVIRAESENAAA